MLDNRGHRVPPGECEDIAEKDQGGRALEDDKEVCDKVEFSRRSVEVVAKH